MSPMPTKPAHPNFRTLDLNLLRVFDEVMAERNLTRAARNLSLTQPAVSNALRRLRETLGEDLVRRSGQGIEPTAHALAMWPAVRSALRQLQELIVPSPFEPATADDTFVLAMADATAAALIPGVVDIIETEAPGVSIRVVPLSTRDPRRLLDEGMPLLETSYEVGMSGPGRLHDLFVTHEAMSPGDYKTRGAGLTIRYGYHIFIILICRTDTVFICFIPVFHEYSDNLISLFF